MRTRRIDLMRPTPAQRELLAALAVPKFEALIMPKFEALEALRMRPVLDSLRNFGKEMATASSRIEQMHASIVIVEATFSATSVWHIVSARWR